MSPEKPHLTALSLLHGPNSVELSSALAGGRLESSKALGLEGSSRRRPIGLEGSSSRARAETTARFPVITAENIDEVLRFQELRYTELYKGKE